MWECSCWVLTHSSFLQKKYQVPRNFNLMELQLKALMPHHFIVCFNDVSFHSYPNPNHTHLIMKNYFIIDFLKCSPRSVCWVRACTQYQYQYQYQYQKRDFFSLLNIWRLRSYLMILFSKNEQYDLFHMQRFNHRNKKYKLSLLQCTVMWKKMYCINCIEWRMW